MAVRASGTALRSSDMSAFQTMEELGGPLASSGSGAPMFDKTLRFAFSNPAQARLKTEVATLGRQIELWRVVSSGHDISLEEPNKYSYLLPLTGRLDVAAGDSEYRAETDSALLFSPNRRRTRVSPTLHEHYEALVLLFPKATIERAVAGNRPAPGDLAMPLHGGIKKNDGLRAYVDFLGAELSRTTSPLARPHILGETAALLEDLLIDLIGGDDQQTLKRHSTGMDYVRRAEELMRARFDEAPTMTDIADALNVSLRSLQIAFHEHRGLAPRAMLNRIRLEEARARLRAARPGQNVGSIALDCGFTHLGRFAISYRKAFGELPSETLR